MRVSVFGTINAQGGVLCKVTKVIIDSCRGAGSIYAHGINYLVFYLQGASSGRFGSCPFGRGGATNAGGGRSGNLLPFIDASGDCSGATCGPTLVNIYGAYMNIFDIDGNFACGEKTYLPAGVFAFKLKILLSAWLYLWQPLAQEAPPAPSSRRSSR